MKLRSLLPIVIAAYLTVVGQALGEDDDCVFPILPPFYETIFTLNARNLERFRSKDVSSTGSENPMEMGVTMSFRETVRGTQFASIERLTARKSNSLLNFANLKPL